MRTLSLSDNKARSIYTDASAELKAILEETFGKDFFNRKITERVTSYQTACDVLGKTSRDQYEGETDDEYAYHQLATIVEALNEGWKPNWTNSDEAKYYPWFYMDDKRGFSLDSVYYLFTDSHVGSRLCFRSRELAEYAVKQFHSIYKTLFTTK